MHAFSSIFLATFLIRRLQTFFKCHIFNFFKINVFLTWVKVRMDGPRRLVTVQLSSMRLIDLPARQLVSIFQTCKNVAQGH